MARFLKRSEALVVPSLQPSQWQPAHPWLQSWALCLPLSSHFFLCWYLFGVSPPMLLLSQGGLGTQYYKLDLFSTRLL